MRIGSVLVGAAAAIAGRAALIRLLLFKFRRDVARLNQGDYLPLLASYADDFVLDFHQGEHRFAGRWSGKAELERFLQNFTAAGLEGEIVDLAISGPLWRMKLWVRFNDHVDAPDGSRIYDNRDVLVLESRWGRVVRQQDFYADTEGILVLERYLREAGVAPVPKTGA